MRTSLIEWLEKHMASCFWKKNFGIECPGCGMQRAFIELLKGNLAESLTLFPALLPIIAMMLLLVLHLIFKFKHGAFYLKILFIFNAALIILSYIYKIIHIH